MEKRFALMLPRKSFSTLVIGLVLVALGLLTQSVMPVWGRVAYQAAAAGSYTPENFNVNLAGYYLVAGVIVFLGMVDVYASWQRSTNHDV
jgi:hypothetical protein